MKFFLFLVCMVAAFLGINYMSFTEGAVERWVKKSQYPDLEAAEVFCSMLTPETQIHFTYVINNRALKTVPPTAEGLCEYYKERVIPGAERKTTWITPKIASVQRSESIPFNQGKSSLTISMRSKGYKATRKLDIELKRSLLGDFRILSIKGHDDIEQEEKPRVRR